MNQFNTILFDVDGTLLDFYACEGQALAQLFQHYGIRYNEKIHEVFHRINARLWGEFEKGSICKQKLLDTRFCELFCELDIHEDGIDAEKNYQPLLSMAHFPVEGAKDVLKRLYADFNLYVVTNAVAATQQRRLSDSGLDIYMKDLFISDLIGSQKPKKEFFEFCFSKIPDFDPAKTIIVGDSLTSDMKGGENAGITTCWYNPGALEKYMQVRVDFEIRKLEELFLILNNEGKIDGESV